MMSFQCGFSCDTLDGQTDKIPWNVSVPADDVSTRWQCRNASDIHCKSTASHHHVEVNVPSGDSDELNSSDRCDM